MSFKGLIHELLEVPIRCHLLQHTLLQHGSLFYQIILESSVGQGEEWVCGGAGQGTTTRNSILFQGVVTQPCAIAGLLFALLRDSPRG